MNNIYNSLLASGIYEFKKIQHLVTDRTKPYPVMKQERVNSRFVISLEQTYGAFLIFLFCLVVSGGCFVAERALGGS